MRPNPLQKLCVPPCELRACVMAEVNAWHRPLSVRWLVGCELLLLAGLLWVSAATLPAQFAQTADAIHRWSSGFVQATLEMSNHIGELLPL